MQLQHLRVRKGLVVLVSAILAVAAGLMFTTPARSQQGAYFYDQFNMNAYDWQAVAGRWTVVDGEYTETVDPAAEESWASAGSTGWFDYTVEARVRSTDTDGTISLAGRWVDKLNYYALEYSSNDSGADSATLILYKKVNGVRVNLKEWTRSTNSKVPYLGAGAEGITGNPYPATFKLKFEGATIEVYVDSTLMGFTSDTSLYYGKIAVGELNRQAYFDEIYVWDVTAPRLLSKSVPYNVGNAVSLEFATDEYTSHQVEYGPTTSYGEKKVTTVRELNHTVDIAGLSPNTLYHYKITVYDAAGNLYSTTEDLTFVTGLTPDLIHPVISAVGTTEITGTSAQISWTSNEAGNSIIEYGTATGSYQWSISRDEKTTDHAITINRLKGKTTYYYRVKTRDVAGNLEVSPEGSFQTLENLKPLITKVITSSTPTPNIMVNWERVIGAVNYQVYVATDNHWSDTPDATIADTGVASYTFQKAGLLANTNYFIKVVAVNAGAASDFTIARAFPPDTNPHGYYWDNPELCQNCHTTHSAFGPRLINELNADKLCLTCHDGSQSKYNVLSGKFKGADNNLHESIAGPYGSLEGITVAEQAYLTSRHDLDIYIYSATGNNIENMELADSHLSCASCHDPHGSENYRCLRGNMAVSLEPDAPQIVSEAYAVTQATAEIPTYVSGAVEFCGACHSDFNQGAGASRLALNSTAQPGLHLSASSQHKYMHPVNVGAQYVTTEGYPVPLPDLPYENGKIICQTCHYSHGTIKTGTHVRRDGFSSTVLKRFDETIGCEDCHDKTDHPDE